MIPDLTRRDFLLSVLGALAGAALGGCGGTPEPAAFRTALFHDRALDTEPIRTLAGIHLARHPEERDPRTLVTRLLGRNPAADPEAIKRVLRARIREDFEGGRTENIDGWVLSLTEVRLWCLYLMAFA